MLHVAHRNGAAQSDHLAERDSLGTVTFCGRLIVVDGLEWEKVAEGRVIEATVGCARCETRRRERSAPPIYDPDREREDIESMYGRRGRRHTAVAY